MLHVLLSAGHHEQRHTGHLVMAYDKLRAGPTFGSTRCLKETPKGNHVFCGFPQTKDKRKYHLSQVHATCNRQLVVLAELNLCSCCQVPPNKYTQKKLTHPFVTTGKHAGSHFFHHAVWCQPSNRRTKLSGLSRSLIGILGAVLWTRSHKGQHMIRFCSFWVCLF